MGIDKSHGENDPIVIINGTVYQYGKIPEWSYYHHGVEKPFPDEWSAEHHSYAKEYFCFKNEQEFKDFIEGLPETASHWTEEELEKWRAMSDEERERERALRPQQMRDVADRKRAERAARPPRSPRQRFIEDAREKINAVLDANLFPYTESFEDREIPRQIELIIEDARRTYLKEIKYWEGRSERGRVWYERTRKAAITPIPDSPIFGEESTQPDYPEENEETDDIAF